MIEKRATARRAIDRTMLDVAKDFIRAQEPELLSSRSPAHGQAIAPEQGLTIRETAKLLRCSSEHVRSSWLIVIVRAFGISAATSLAALIRLPKMRVCGANSTPFCQTLGISPAP
jgi:hypothetical protein